MMTVVVAGGGFSFLLSWELMTISSFILILFEAERTEVRRAALNYLVMMHIGFMFLVAAFATVYAAEGGTTFAALADRPTSPCWANISARSPPCRCSWSSLRASA